MFKIGSIIVYGNHGPCEVTAVGTITTQGVDKEKLFYTLCPYYSRTSKIFTPVDNQKVIMRAILTKNEVIQIIDEMNEIEVLWISDEKKRESEYKEALSKCDCRELVRIIKTIYARKLERIAEGKKITAADERYFKMAEENLYGELAIPLELTKEETREFVVDRVEQQV